MKKLNTILFIALFVVLAMPFTAFAQNDLTVPLSRPGKAGVLEVSSVYADDVIIRTHSGQDVIVKFDGDDDKDDYDNRRNGLRRISSGGIGMEVTEDNNRVIVRTSPSAHDLELEIMVPSNFSLELHITHGDIEVYGVNGELEINAVNGDVEMMDVSGSALINSVNGDVEVEFKEVTDGAPMSFTTVNGDIEIALPESVKMSAKMKTEWGDIYTNFDMEIDRNSNAAEVSKDKGKYKVAINKWVYGSINGGGAEYLFKTLHGDISIRKN